MKLPISIAFIVVAFLAYTAQAQRGCRGAPRPATCREPRNEGMSGQGCRPRIMWYYNGISCERMRYRGCGGNSNRYCERILCQRNCR